MLPLNVLLVSRNLRQYDVLQKYSPELTPSWFCFHLPGMLYLKPNGLNSQHPMTSDRATKFFCIALQAWDIVPFLMTAFSFYFPGTFNHPNALQARPFCFVLQPVNIWGHHISAGFYSKHYCFLPRYVFSGKHLLATYLRPSNIDPAYGVWSILKLLSNRFREVWPNVNSIIWFIYWTKATCRSDPLPKNWRAS